jgi:outer membrane protein assembly factor BamB
MQNPRAISWFVGMIVAMLFAGEAASENWSQFRGANEDGVVSDAKLPIEWGPKNHVLWKVKLPGLGWSQPIVWGEKIFLTTAESDNPTKPDPKFITFDLGEKAPDDVNYRQKVLCLEVATGKTLWERTARDGRPTHRMHINNTYASETPATDGERVVAYFGMSGVYCFDLAGNPLWTRDLGSHSMLNDWGTGSSPIIFGDKVYIQCDNEDASFLVALDKKTGKDAWRVSREEQTNWSTPYIWKNKIRTELVTAGGAQTRSYDPQSGKLLWSITGSGRTATTPVGDADLLYVDSYQRDSGHTGVFAAIRPGASGDISLGFSETNNEFVAWSIILKGCRLSSPAICRDCIYILDQFLGIIHCHDAKTGQEHYRKRMPGSAAGFMASALVSGDKVYCMDQRGRTHVVQAGPELKILALNKLSEEMTWSSPAVIGDRILIRTTGHLFAIGDK